MENPIRHKKLTYAAVIPSAQRLTAGGNYNTGILDGEPYDHAIMYVNCTARVSGSVTIYLQGSPDDGTTWYTGLGNSGTINAATTKAVKITAPISKVLRLSAQHAASTDITYSVSLELVKQ